MKIRVSTLARKLGYSPGDWGAAAGDIATIGPNREILIRGTRMGHLTRAEYESLQQRPPASLRASIRRDK